MSKLEKWEVTLILTFDSDKAGKPENWNWDELLDLSGDESVYIDDAKFIEDVVEDD